MGVLWSGFVDLLQMGLFGLTHFYGGHLGPAIVSFALLARLALLPVTLKQSIRSRSQARAVKRLQPALEVVRRKWADDPNRMAKETMAVYEREGVRPLDPGFLKGMLIQSPLFLGLFQVIRAASSGAAARQSFLWVSSLAKPDLFLTLLVSGAVGVGAMANGTGSAPTPRTLLLVSMAGTLVMLLRLSSGFALYMGASAAVSTLQGLILRRMEPRPPESLRA